VQGSERIGIAGQALAAGSRLSTLARIGGVVSSPGDQQERAAEALEILKSAVPYASASLQAWDPLRARHVTLANAGYPEHALAHLDTWFVASDEAYRYMREVDGRPLRWRDMPFDYRSLYSATEYWLPLGYDEGVTTCLFDGRGRYTGNLHLNVDSRRHPTDAAMDVLNVLQRMLAGLVDLLSVPTHVAKLLGQDAEAGLLAPDGSVLSLPGCAPMTQLAAEEQLVQRVADIAQRPTSTSAMLWRDGSRRWHRLHLHRLEHATLLLDKITALPHRLTAREVDVLTLAASGASNARIAAELSVSHRTVAKHVEHLFEKLCCHSRSGLVRRALQEGLLRIDL
jgi:DNA-binding CsgD family transcriptional regulator